LVSIKQGSSYLDRARWETAWFVKQNLF